MYPYLISPTENNYSLVLSDFEKCEKLFFEAGYSGGGYDWQTLLKYLIETEKPDLLPLVHFDSESSMFCAYGEDKPALEEVEKMIEKLISDPILLKEKIKLVPKESWS